jgi:DNA-binding GntR family transcriptional regulator
VPSRFDAGDAAALPRRLSRATPKGRQLREILEGLVASLEPGSPLPSERALVDRYGVARMTVRAELDRLAAEGHVYRVHGRGTFVAEPRVAQAGALSSFTEDMRARGMVPGSVVLDHEVVEAPPLVARHLELAPGAEVVRIERLRTAAGTPMALERAYVSAARAPALAEADLEDASLYELLEGELGVRLGDADQRVVAVPLDAEEAELLEVKPGQPGLRFETVARDADGEPVYHATSLFRGDRYEIRLHQERR